MKYPKWVTKAGKKISIANMDDDHLINTVKMLYRRAVERKLSLPYPNFNGEMAQYHAEQEYEAYVNQTPEEMFPILVAMTELAKKRGLDWNAKPKANVPASEILNESDLAHLRQFCKRLSSYEAVGISGLTISRMLNLVDLQNKKLKMAEKALQISVNAINNKFVLNTLKCIKEST